MILSLHYSVIPLRFLSFLLFKLPFAGGVVFSLVTFLTTLL